MDGLVSPAVAPSLAPWVPRRRIDVHEYHRMTAAGILQEDDRVELIEGELVHMPAMGGPHIGAVMALTRMLVPAAAGRAAVSIQSSIRLDFHSEPEPDVALLRLRGDDYRGLPPLAADVPLLIEVADTTLRFDTEVKAPLYARHAIPEYWVVDLAGQCVLRHREPKDGLYRDVQPVGPDGVLTVPGLPDIGLAVAAILGTAPVAASGPHG